MKQIFLHIGPHKTGTTYLQKVLFDSKKELESHGVHYSDKLVGPQWGHHKLVESVKRRDDEIVKNFFDSLNDNSIISSENFENLSASDVDYLFSFLKYYRVNVIFVKRAYADLLVSNWQEDVKHGSDKPWSSFILENVIKPYSSVILNQTNTLKKWQGYCENIIVVDYDELKRSNVDIVDYFLKEILLLPNVEISTGQHVNASMNYLDVEIIRILNGLYKGEFGVSPGTKIRDTYLRMKSKGSELISENLELLSPFITAVDFSNSWGITFFTEEFRKQFQSGISGSVLVNETYMLPAPDMNYILVNSAPLNELYCLAKIEVSL
jgi:hypothetical protein